MIRLIQLRKGTSRRVAMVEEPNVRLLDQFTSIHELVRDALVTDTKIAERIQFHLSKETLPYDPIYHGKSVWQLLPPIDYPNEPSRCLVSGTGLTHLGSAKDRNAMHGANDRDQTDSMKMFRLGVEGGRPAPGKIGTPPEWFFKGAGTILRAHGESLDVPPYAEDGGEEAEIAGVYMVGPEGQPIRIGMALGNEFSDHQFEKKNYLNLAGSKIRTCAIGPELVIDPGFQSVPGKVRIERKGKEFWSKEIVTGEAEMCHSLQNIEHHHFKFETHRRPGDVHVHYFGACSLSFGAGVKLADGDVMEVSFEGFGRALRNPLRVVSTADALISVQALK